MSMGGCVWPAAKKHHDEMRIEAMRGAEFCHGRVDNGRMISAYRYTPARLRWQRGHDPDLSLPSLGKGPARDTEKAWNADIDGTIARAVISAAHCERYARGLAWKGRHKVPFEEGVLP